MGNQERRDAPSREIAMKLLSKNDVRALTLYSHAQRDRLEKAGKFPRRVKLGAHPNARVGYVESEIVDWITAHVAIRDAPSH